MRRAIAMTAIACTVSFACSAPGTERPDYAGELVCSVLTEGSWQIWSFDLESGRSERWTDGMLDKRYPCSGAGRAIVYHTSNQETYQVDTPGQAARALFADFEPLRDVVFAPDGTRAVFSKIRTDVIDSSNLWIADGVDARPRMLTNEIGIQGQAAWSYDGRRLAFVTGTGYGTYEIWVLDLETGARTRLTENHSHEFFPAWSPDGTRVAFSSDASGDYEVWSMNVDGTNQTQLTHSPGIDSRPSWSPDGDAIAFTSRRGGKLGVWVMNTDGTEPRTLIELEGEACDPLWR
jgi:Tol biopolymer transport system component